LLYWSDINKQNQLSPIPLESLSILGHHKQLDAEANAFFREIQTQRIPVFITDGLQEAIKLVHDIADEEKLKLHPIDQKLITNTNPKDFVAELFTVKLSRFVNKNEDDRSRARFLYSLLKGILHYSDWHSSAGLKVNYSVKTDSEHILNLLETRCNERGIEYKGLRNFRKSA
jgi:CRISPR-associated endonuclease/helicase Cas3